MKVNVVVILFAAVKAAEAAAIDRSGGMGVVKSYLNADENAQVLTANGPANYSSARPDEAIGRRGKHHWCWIPGEVCTKTKRTTPRQHATATAHEFTNTTLVDIGQE